MRQVRLFFQQPVGERASWWISSSRATIAKEAFSFHTTFQNGTQKKTGAAIIMPNPPDVFNRPSFYKFTGLCKVKSGVNGERSKIRGHHVGKNGADICIFFRVDSF
jgi:hypothetical protein